MVDDLDRGRQLVGIDPDDDLFMDALALCREWMGRRGGHCYYELGSPLLSHASSRRPTVRKPEVEPHPEPGGQPKRERPAEHLDRVWPDTGPTGIL